MVLTPTEVSVYSTCTATVGTIIAGKYIEVVQQRIIDITNYDFTISGLYVHDAFTFYPSTYSIVSNGSDFLTYGFAVGDDICIQGSYRNDGIYTIASISGQTIVLTTGTTIYDELSGASIIIAVVRWPITVKKIAAGMVQYDIEVRPKMKSGVTSRSLGPLSETFNSDDFDAYGYPRSITGGLADYRVALLY